MTHIERFTDVLLQEIALRKHQYDGTPVTAVFFGGGTPSLLTPEAISRITATLRSTMLIADNAEWTMECNPGTVTFERLDAYRASGINRL